MATYHISTLTDLQNMSAHLSDDCILDNDIDASATSGWNETFLGSGIFLGFAPISTFAGTFDGQNHTISGLYINRTSNIGLFGFVSRSSAGGFIKDLIMTGCNIIGNYYTGTLIGRGTASTKGYMTISNVHVSGSILNKGSHASGEGVGGCVGGCTKLVFTDCSANVNIAHYTNVTLNHEIGGFAGWAGANFTNCYAMGNIFVSFDGADRTFAFGGFAGSIGEGTGDVITSCWASGTLTIDVTTTGNVAVGGFYGRCSTSASTTLKCVASGNVSFISSMATGLSIDVGGFVGSSSMPIDQCRATGNVENKAGANASAGGFGGNLAGTGANGPENCFATGTVCLLGINDANASIGGFNGKSGTMQGISNCYARGEVFALATNGGGFTGTIGVGATFTSCYWDMETSGWLTSAGGTGKSTLDMKTPATYSGWDFTTIWEMPLVAA